MRGHDLKNSSVLVWGLILLLACAGPSLANSDGYRSLRESPLGDITGRFSLSDSVDVIPDADLDLYGGRKPVPPSNSRTVRFVSGLAGTGVLAAEDTEARRRTRRLTRACE